MSNIGNLEVKTGYIPGVIGRIAGLHGQYYARDWDLGYFFEAKAATGLSQFISNYNEDKDCIWSIIVDGDIEGSITIEGPKKGNNTAHLRWFIISDKLKGKGVGNLLLDNATTFCQQKDYEKIYLDTFKGLDTARYLYEKYGFTLIEEKLGNKWGIETTEQSMEAKIRSSNHG